MREAIRQNGINKFISKYDVNKEIKSYSLELQTKIYNTQRELIGKFKGYSLHCGGIIYLRNTEEYLIEGKNTSILQQVNLNKIDVPNTKTLKLTYFAGIVSAHFCNQLQEINFNMNIGDPDTINLLSKGNNIGITLAEHLDAKALLVVNPKQLWMLRFVYQLLTDGKNAQRTLKW